MPCRDLVVQIEKAASETAAKDAKHREKEELARKQRRNAISQKALKNYAQNKNDLAEAESMLIGIGVSKKTLGNPENFAALVFFAQTQGYKKFSDAMKNLVLGRVAVNDYPRPMDVQILRQFASQMGNVMAADSLCQHMCRVLQRSLDSAQ